MKSYLDLVPISAKVHRKQNRMSIICIVLAVFLVTAIFGMADMFIRGQILQAQQENGNWHIGIQNISDEDAMLISSRPEVATPPALAAFAGPKNTPAAWNAATASGVDGMLAPSATNLQPLAIRAFAFSSFSSFWVAHGRAMSHLVPHGRWPSV